MFYSFFSLMHLSVFPLLHRTLKLHAFLLLFSFPLLLFAAKDKNAAPHIDQVRLTGYVGERIDGCIQQRVMTQDVDEIVSPFRHQDEVHNLWGTEFWGKWVQGAMSAYRYNHDPALYEKIRQSVELMLATQLPDGYIGNYDKDHQLQGWDVWGRKYTLLGLIKWYDLSSDKRVLKAARRLLDYTISQFGPDKKHVWEAGLYRGMPPMSILEPVMLLYHRTREKAYLDFAQYIVNDGEQTGGPKLLAKADVPVALRFPIENPKQWWTHANGQKAYEMMSCYVGLLELMKVTGNADYLQIAERVYHHILNEEINICGSGSAYECWYGGRQKQTRPSSHSMETCVTFTWMQFNERLWQLTSRSLYIDQIERTMYNALMASMRGDNGQIAKYIPLEGYRHEGENQCNLHINCCNANGPRAFAMIPRVTYAVHDPETIDVNLYIPSQADITIGKTKVHLQQITDYPASDDVELRVTPSSPTAFALRLRIPAWSSSTQVTINGQSVSEVHPGNYLTLQRTWASGDVVKIRFDMTAHLSELNHYQAVQRGPIVLARNSRFQDGFVDEPCIIPHQGNAVTLTSVEAPQGIWMAFETRMPTGTYANGEAEYSTVRFCDFASAGNTWNRSERYRVWLPKTLDAQNEFNNHD